MKTLRDWAILTFGLPGSFSYAIRQMRAGKEVRRKSALAAGPSYKISGGSPNWIISRLSTRSLLKPATFIVDDYLATDWRIY